MSNNSNDTDKIQEGMNKWLEQEWFPKTAGLSIADYYECTNILYKGGDWKAFCDQKKKK